MSDVILDGFDGPVIPVQALTEADAGRALEALGAGARAFAALSDFKGKAGQMLLLPGDDGAPWPASCPPGPTGSRTRPRA